MTNFHGNGRLFWLRGLLTRGRWRWRRYLTCLAKRPAKTAGDLRNASESSLAEDIDLLFGDAVNACLKAAQEAAAAYKRGPTTTGGNERPEVEGPPEILIPDGVARADARAG